MLDEDVLAGFYKLFRLFGELVVGIFLDDLAQVFHGDIHIQLRLYAEFANVKASAAYKPCVFFLTDTFFEEHDGGFGNAFLLGDGAPFNPLCTWNLDIAAYNPVHGIPYILRLDRFFLQKRCQPVLQQPCGILCFAVVRGFKTFADHLAGAFARRRRFCVLATVFR